MCKTIKISVNYFQNSLCKEVMPIYGKSRDHIRVSNIEIRVPAMNKWRLSYWDLVRPIMKGILMSLWGVRLA